jgi:hypothetical protein
VDGVGFMLGGSDHEYVRVELLGWSSPDSDDYWDGNWLFARVSLAVGGFRGGYQANFRTDELDRFLKQLGHLHSKLKGEAVFDTLEGQLRLRCVGDGRGHIAVTGEAQDEAGLGHRLAFTLELDQTQLAPLMNDLTRSLDQFPVRGSPAL